MQTRTAILGGGALLGAAALAYARWEASSYRLRRTAVPVLEPGESDLRILHLSDLHMTPSRHRLQDWVASLAELRPDLVIVTGDFLAHREAIDPVMNALEPLLHVPGAFVLGSNDYYAPRMKNPLRYFDADSIGNWPIAHSGLATMAASRLRQWAAICSIRGASNRSVA